MSTGIWAAISTIGSPVAVFLLALLFFAVAEEMERFIHHKKRERWRKASKLILLSVLISIMLSLGLKAFTANPRPCIPCSEGHADGCNPYCPPVPGNSPFSWPGDYSFPSGHAAIAFAATGGLFASIKRRKYVLLFIFPAFVGISRVMIGVHTIWDVLGGAAVGLASADIAELMLERKKRKKIKESLRLH